MFRFCQHCSSELPLVAQRSEAPAGDHGERGAAGLALPPGLPRRRGKQVPGGNRSGVGEINTLPTPNPPHTELAQNILSNTKGNLSYTKPQPQE